MDRQIIYPGQIPLETDLLNTNRNMMVALGMLAADLFGTSTIATGLACTQLGTPALSVQVGPGRIYSLQNLDGTAYSSLAADTTHQLVKQGILLDAVTLATPAPTTVGYSINYLIQASYQDSDTTSVTLPYYNATNPAQAYTGPAGSGSSQPTQRKGALIVQAKAGVAAATGSQATPAPDSGFVGLYSVTVAYGQSTVLNANIAQLQSAPFVQPIPAGVRTNLLVTGNGPFANPALSDGQHLVEVVNDNSSYQCFALSAYGAATNGNNFHWNRYFGTLAAPTNVQSGAYIMSQGFRGWDGTGNLSQSMAAHQAVTTENWDASHHGMRFQWECTVVGGSTRVHIMELDGAKLTLFGYAQIGDGTSATARILNNSTSAGALQIHGSGDQAGGQSLWYGSANVSAAGEAWHRGNIIRFQNLSGTDEVVIDSSGNLLVGLSSGSTHTIQKSVTANVGNAVLGVGIGGYLSAFYAVNGVGANAANAALRLLKDSTTSRSINAAGTINASGADYAEYMRKAPGCGALAKGAIVGIDANGELTDRWADAVSWLVKSTDPSYVGGDTWAAHIDEPVEPTFEAPVYAGAECPGDAPEQPAEFETEQDAAAFAERLERHAAETAARAADIAAHQAAVAAARTAFDAGPWADYLAAKAKAAADLEAARAGVDRMAFAGQVPVNVLGAQPGDYIVPVKAGEGIDGRAVTAPTFDEYRIAVGKVIAIEADGRARVIVKAA